ncbi:MAG: LysR family transcriptional regulator, partial [Microcoleus sp. SIO2G3]|nr:LysR family transcriptional regulator [Microcoleus sp. SIO2G3]
EQVALTERGLRELNNLQRGELRIGSSLTIGNYWLPDKISQFKQEYPGILVNCTLANAEEICEGTATGLFDLGLVTGDIKPSLQQHLEQEAVGSDRLQIIVGRSHPWFGQAKISASDLTTTNWVMREAGSGVQRMFEQALQQWDINTSELNVVLTLNSSEMVKAVVESGVGAAAIPEVMVQKERQLSTLWAVQVVLSGKKTDKLLEIIQPVWKLKHRRRFQTRLAIAFEEMLLPQAAAS